LVIDAKGIYSVEKFNIARRLMYWQVYLHKTVISAEKLLINILSRAKELSQRGEDLFGSPAFKKFLNNNFDKESFLQEKEILELFSELDDNDIFLAAKVWKNSSDKVLSILCRKLVHRELFKIELSNKPFETSRVEMIQAKTRQLYDLNVDSVKYFAFTGSIANNAYNPKSDKIKLLYKNNEVVDIAEAADQLNISVLSTQVEKYFLCYPKQLDVNN